MMIYYLSNISSDPVNLSADLEISIKGLTELISKLTRFKGKMNWDRSKSDGQPRRRLGTTQAKRELGFIVKMVFEEGLKRTIEWCEKNIYRVLNYFV